MEKITLDNILKLSKESLKNKIIIFPTDTVYGVACLYKDEVGKEKIYQMKKRDYGKPLPVLCSSIDQAKQIALIPDNEYMKLWPGALTIIFNTIDKSDTIAIRIPNSNIALKIIEHFGPLYTTSVNYSGEKEINTIEEIENLFSDYVDYLVTDKQTFSKIPSTIISLTGEKVKVLREGSIKIK